MYIGPRAQAVILPLLAGREDAVSVFSPRTAWQEENDRRASVAKVRRRNYRPKGPPVDVGEVFDTAAFNKAIRRAVDRANSRLGNGDQIPRWTSNQIRHQALTKIRGAHGLEVAQKIGGHRQASTTEHYAAPTDRAAIDYALENG